MKNRPSGPPDLNDDEPDTPIVKRTVPAHQVTPPATSAANSVFDAGRKAKAEAAGPVVDPVQIVIRKGVPKPATRAKGVTYLSVIQQMAPSDSVELPLKQARGFYSQAKKHGAASAPPPAVQLSQAQRDAGRRVA